MQFDVAAMRSGANRSDNAAWLAMEAADQLSRAAVPAGIFGAVAAAESFCSAVDKTHSNHVERLRGQQNRLGVLGDKTHTTASAFLDMEGRNAEALRSVL